MTDLLKPVSNLAKYSDLAFGFLIVIRGVDVHRVEEKCKITSILRTNLKNTVKHRKKMFLLCKLVTYFSFIIFIVINFYSF